MPSTTATAAIARQRPSWLAPLFWISSGFAVMLARRTDQITDPQVWVEEGAQFIPSFL